MKQPNPIVSSIIVAEKRHADTDIISVVANILGNMIIYFNKGYSRLLSRNILNIGW